MSDQELATIASSATSSASTTPSPTLRKYAKVLIVSNQPAVRAHLIQQLQGRVEFKEAMDGGQAWQMILMDATIQVILSSMQLEGMDGYALLNRIRSSRMQRVQSLPLIAIAQSMDLPAQQAEQDRTAKAGANDFILPNINAVELISRIDSSMRLYETLRTLEQNRDGLTNTGISDGETELVSAAFLEKQCDMMFAFSKRYGNDFSCLCVVIDSEDLDDEVINKPQQKNQTSFISILETTLAPLFMQVVRKEDCVARTGAGEFTILAPGISLNSAQAFAKRLSGALLRTKIMHDDHALTVTLSIGVASVMTDTVMQPEHIRQIAKRRSEVASMHGGNQIIGMEEERRLNHVVEQAMREQENDLKVDLNNLHSAATKLSAVTSVDAYPLGVSTAIQWIQLGREKEVLPHLKTLYRDIQPLLNLLQQHKHLLT